MKLSVVIPNRNDTIMLGITVKSALEGLKAIDNDGEVVVVDNSDEDIWRIIRTPNKSPISLGEVQEGRVKLIRQKHPGLYTARQTAMKNADGEYIYNSDSHTLYGHNHFKDLVEFMDNDKDQKVGFGFSPIGWVAQMDTYARHDIRTDQGTIFGNWGRQYDEPTKICWNFGSRICRRDWFLKEHGGYGFYAKKEVSWGGGEFYAALKGWLMGKENWAVPCSPQYHIGPFSTEVQRIAKYAYRVYGSSGKTKVGIGILAAFYALGGESMKEEAKKAEPGLKQNHGITVDQYWSEARKLAKEDWQKLKQRQVISYHELMKQQPWHEGWDESKRWTEWKPFEKIRQVFDLNTLM